MNKNNKKYFLIKVLLIKKFFTGHGQKNNNKLFLIKLLLIKKNFIGHGQEGGEEKKKRKKY